MAEHICSPAVLQEITLHTSKSICTVCFSNTHYLFVGGIWAAHW